jgi:hypothetical protein
LAELGAAEVTLAELESIAAAIMASPHIGNVAVPLTQAGIVAALATIEENAASDWEPGQDGAR